MGRRLFIMAVTATFALGLVAVFTLSSMRQFDGTLIADIPYGDASTRQKLDLYLPDGEGPFPVILFVHGGGFSSGHKRAANPRAVIRAGLARGYAVASTNYRRSGEALFPAAADDVIAAVRFLQDHADDYDLARNRVATWGASAGGNLAAMAALSDDTNVQAAVIWFGPIRFDQMDAQFETLGLDPMLGATDAANSPESQYLGVAVGAPEAADLVLQASPQSYITSDDPPVLIQHGTADRNVPILQSEFFAAELADVIGPSKVEFDAIAGAGHGGDAFVSDANFDRVFLFLNAHLTD
ncbi:MAG: alpha/beta hydrolase [Pseudomonadota bacterium]